MPWYLKVDIEGCDRFCLEALLDFDVRPALLSIEAERRDFSLLRAELDLLERLGYCRFMAVPQGLDGRSLVTETLAGERLEYSFGRDASGPFGDDLGGRWVRRGALQRRYRYTHLHQALIGRWRRSRRWRRLWWRFARRFPRLGAGCYYDTHARLGSEGL